MQNYKLNSHRGCFFLPQGGLVQRPCVTCEGINSNNYTENYKLSDISNFPNFKTPPRQVDAIVRNFVQ